MRISDWSSDVCSSDLLKRSRIYYLTLFKRDRSERGDQNIKRVSGMMKKLSISAKMIMAFAGLLAMIAGIGAFAVFKIGEVNDLSAQMRTRWLPATQLIGDLHAYTSQYRIAQSGLVLAVDPGSRRKAEIQLKNASTAISGLLNDYKRHVVTPEQKALYDNLVTSWGDYGKLTDQMVSLSNDEDPAGATDLSKGGGLRKFYIVADDRSEEHTSEL